MSIKFYLNPDFKTYANRKSGVTYVKITGMLDSSMFSVFSIIETRKTAIQSFQDITREHLNGLSSNTFSEIDFYSKAFALITIGQQTAFMLCVNELERSFKNHASKTTIDINEQADIYNEIKRFKKEFYNRCNTSNTKINAESQDNKNFEAWKNIDNVVAELPANELNEIVEKLNGNSKFVIVGEREYRIEEINNEAVLQYRDVAKNVTGNEIKKVETSTVNPKFAPRQYEELALLNDVDGLNEFVRGHIYRIKNENSGYISLENEFGELREISARRVNRIRCYTEAPKPEFAE